MLIVSSNSELLERNRIWGTGGWLSPEKREALDWLTFSRFMGWSGTVVYRKKFFLEKKILKNIRWVVIACHPDSLEKGIVTYLAERINTEPLFVLARAGRNGNIFARLAGVSKNSEKISGRFLSWIGPGKKRCWRCRKTFYAEKLSLLKEVTIWATLEGNPVIAGRRIGKGMIATLGFHPSEARDADGSATALLKHLLIWGSPAPVAWLDLEGTFILRMDDPGSAESVYNRHYSFPKLGEEEWADINEELKKRNARISIGYVAGWVDDGDRERGVLKVHGKVPNRITGQVYPSKLVKYEMFRDHDRVIVSDYESEFRGIQSLRTKGLGDVELHGYTHIHPNTALWARALDRYEARCWYRELGRGAAPTIATQQPCDHPLSLGIAAFRQYFQVQPTTLICPGDEWTNEVLEHALKLKLQLVSSYYLALRHKERFCWSQHVCAPYLNQPDSAWFDSGLPVVGYFHDYDLAIKGVGWMSKWLNRWQSAGVKRFLDFRELAAAVRRKYSLEEHSSIFRMKIRGKSAPRLVRPLKVMIKVSDGKMPSHVSVSIDKNDLLLKVHPLDYSMGYVILPASV
jgi:hypothetical protein